jgi:DnaK suppressor protein
MDAGKYGVCEACGDRIALARLLALPHARDCIRCARGRDRVRAAGKK